MAYTTVSGDTWDQISKNVYGNEMYADVLMAANLDYIDVFLFDSGVVIATPELTRDTSAQLPPWKVDSA